MPWTIPPARYVRGDHGAGYEAGAYRNNYTNHYRCMSLWNWVIFTRKHRAK